MSSKEAMIADLILADPHAASRLTINEIADRLGMAPSTVFQFTRTLGYKGFRDFRTNLLTEEFDPEISIHENVLADDSNLTMAQKVFSSTIKSLQETQRMLDEASLDRAAGILLGSRLVSFFGAGGSNVVAYDAYHKFLRSPIRCQYAADAHIQLMQASLMTPEDCAVVITHTGLTRETLKVAEVARRTGAHVIAISAYPSPQLTSVSDVLFVSVSEETGYRSESLSSRIAQQSIIDALFTIVMFRAEKDSARTLAKIRDVIGQTKLDVTYSPSSPCVRM